MGKGTNFSGQPVLSQLIKLMDRSKINTLASKSGANYYTKHLDGYSHLVVMLYSVLSNLRSLRETCLGFAANATRMNHLGIDHMICRSTLSDANKRRKSSIITSVQVETAVFADCHFLQEAVENSERVTKSTVEDLYADGAYQSPENREFAKSHDGMQLKTGKMQGGCRWELIPHGEDGLTVREIATGNTYEAVKAVTKQRTRKRWRIPWNNKTGSRYFEDKDIEAYKLRKQIESLPPEEQRKRNNVEAAMFQYSFHTRNGKTRYRGLLKHRIHAYSRCMWMNLRRMVIFQISTFQRPIFALFRPLRGAFGCIAIIFENIFTGSDFCRVSPRMVA